MKCLDVYVYNSWEFGVSLRLILVNSRFRRKRKLEKEKRVLPPTGTGDVVGRWWVVISMSDNVVSYCS